MSDQAPNPTDSLSARGVSVGVVVSRFNGAITDRLLAGARQEFAQLGGEPDSLVVMRAPGAYELPIVTKAMIETGDVDAVVALGCLIQGQTRHDRVIADAVAQGLMRVGLDSGVPVALGVLTVKNAAQAMARSGGDHGNRGADAMRAAIETARAIAPMKQPI